jgi:hypothetical protein
MPRSSSHSLRIARWLVNWEKMSARWPSLTASSMSSCKTSCFELAVTRLGDLRGRRVWDGRRPGAASTARRGWPRSKPPMPFLGNSVVDLLSSRARGPCRRVPAARPRAGCLMVCSVLGGSSVATSDLMRRSMNGLDLDTQARDVLGGLRAASDVARLEARLVDRGSRASGSRTPTTARAGCSRAAYR